MLKAIAKALADDWPAIYAALGCGARAYEKWMTGERAASRQAHRVAWFVYWLVCKPEERLTFWDVCTWGRYKQAFGPEMQDRISALPYWRPGKQSESASESPGESPSDWSI